MPDSFSNRAYEYIQGKVLRNELLPDTRLSENKIAKELGISRTPVREAIGLLANEGVLYQLPSRGTFVARPSRQQLVDTFEVRLAMECFAATKAAGQMKQTQIQELTQQWRQMITAAHDFRLTGERVMSGTPLKLFLEADMRFHNLILEATGNRLILKIVADAHVRSRVFGFSFCERDLSHIAKVCLCHGRICRAIRRRDGQSAAKFMELHIRESFQDALNNYDQQQAADDYSESRWLKTSEQTRVLLSDLRHLVQT
ncbi:GntR family transcriptional regulator [Calycomorphotria hydatis]|uniref:Putative HTH-type transcriptional regulator YdfH n=1 Tax=Calycomorphotria hydatis TaxID=2528027 RepID=A0A517T698_9PLAN|nr:GntR family transcriptional regulator [Calycomorphotria hydatis]QDT63881.1 putative HTH-type transcriptional regulator YdfH [Calycomorphotria hydatis]